MAGKAVHCREMGSDSRVFAIQNFSDNMGTLSGTVNLIGNDNNGGAVVNINELEAYFETTAEDGRFTLISIPEGNYTVTATIPGYLPVTESVAISGGQTTILDLEMEAVGQPINDLYASQGAYDYVELTWSEQDGATGYNIYRKNTPNAPFGEPLANYDHLMRSLDTLTQEWALGWSPTRITVSTCGLIPNLKRFLVESKCNLAISMHTPFHDERLKLMPVEKSHPVKEVIHAVKQHDWHGQRRLSFEYIIFKDLNHSKDHIKEIARLLGGTRCRFNLIRYHAVPGSPLKSPDAATMTWFRDSLNEKGIIATIRASRGQDIDAACGLLSTKELL